MGENPKRGAWMEGRQLKQDLKTPRVHVKRGPTGSAQPGRKSIEERIKVTRCANCGELGHWKKEWRKANKKKVGFDDSVDDNATEVRTFK